MKKRISDQWIDLEFAYTSYDNSCRDLYSVDVLCRRPRGHDGEHASGFGRDRIRWTDQPIEPVKGSA